MQKSCNMFKYTFKNANTEICLHLHGHAQHIMCRKCVGTWLVPNHCTYLSPPFWLVKPLIVGPITIADLSPMSCCFNQDWNRGLGWPWVLNTFHPRAFLQLSCIISWSCCIKFFGSHVKYFNWWCWNLVAGSGLPAASPQFWMVLDAGITPNRASKQTKYLTNAWFCHNLPLGNHQLQHETPDFRNHSFPSDAAAHRVENVAFNSSPQRRSRCWFMSDQLQP